MRYFAASSAHLLRRGLAFTRIITTSPLPGPHRAPQALGYQTEASGLASFTANRDTVADGKYAFATGELTIASGDISTATGEVTELTEVEELDERIPSVAAVGHSSGCSGGSACWG